MILVLTAVDKENQLLRANLTQPTTEQYGHLNVTHGQLADHALAIASCGVGKTAAAATAAVLINHVKPELVAMVGCAGAYPGSNLVIGDLAVASEEIHGDEGVATTDDFLDMEQLGFTTVCCGEQCFYNRFPVTQPLSQQLYSALQPFADQQQRVLGYGPFVTVSSCSGSLALGQQRRQRTAGLIENMEGAAVAQVCTQYQRPFFELRAISNLVEDRNMDHWDLPLAMLTAQQAFISLLQQGSLFRERTSCTT
ncbi:MAG: futalosine hydrolase [Desulfuromonas sp.]|nr:futalosine hydrolase [Desulfuromonas sp.]